MGELHFFGESATRRVSEAAVDEGQATHSVVEPGSCSAYNLSRGRFLGVDVEVADFSTASLETRLPALVPQSGLALWIIPFRGLSPANIHVPLDLLYLDQNNVVLDMVEFFPIGRVSSSSKPAASVLALPADTIDSVQICVGDQLVICGPEEMKRQLRSVSQVDAGSKVPALQKDHHSRVQISSATPALTDASRDTAIAMHPEQAKDSRKNPPTNWLQRLFKLGPRELRRARREPIPGIVAYFFTGGAPAPHGIRDISTSGLYIFTEERWYLGTIIRLTITDRREATVERSITVNARVVRWGNDGAGLEFLLRKDHDRRHRYATFDEPTGNVTRRMLQMFLERVKAVKN